MAYIQDVNATINSIQAATEVGRRHLQLIAWCTFTIETAAGTR